LSRRLGWDGVWITIVSAFLAVLLWLQVTAADDQVIRNTFRVKLVPKGLSEDLAPLNLPDEVNVTAEGTRSQLRSLTPDVFDATIDFSGAKIGSAPYQILVKSPPFAGSLVRSRWPMNIELAKVGSKSFPVSLEGKNQLPEGLTYGGANSMPNTVLVSGPEPELHRVDLVRAILDFSTLRPGDTPVLPLEAMARDGTPILGLKLDPERVKVRPRILDAPATSNVRIEVRWKGQPAFGYSITRVLVDPDQLELSGESSILGAIQKVMTEPVDVTSLSTSKTFVAPIQFPSGTRSTGKKTVNVRVEVTRISSAE
jgi:YbbR domain-containing protein